MKLRVFSTLILLLWTINCIAWSPLPCELQQCLYNVTNADDTGAYGLEKNINIYDSQSLRFQEKTCSIDLNNFWEDIRQNSSTPINISVRCIYPIKLHFFVKRINLSFSLPLNLKIHKCQLTINNIAQMSRSFTLNTLGLFETEIANKETDCTESDKNDPLKHAESLVLKSNDNANNQSVSKLFQSFKVHENLHHIHLFNITEPLQNLLSEFSNLKTITLNNLSDIDTFSYTWNGNNESSLINSGKFGNADPMQSICFNDIELNILKNHHVHQLTIESCGVLGLDKFDISGALDIIQIRNNIAQVLVNTMFTRVSSVQYIDLSYNKISVVQEGTFKSLQNLGFLSLQHNNISVLPKTLFKDLKAVIFLDLSFNKIDRITSEMFSSMDNLHEIHLENNLLKLIPNDAFLITQTFMNNVFLDNNPLEQIPEFLFYFRNLKKASLRNTSVALDNLTKLSQRINFGAFMDSVVPTTSGRIGSIFSAPSQLRLIDLSFSNVTNIDLGLPLVLRDGHSDTILNLLLIKFNLQLHGNDLVCDCSLNAFLTWVKSKLKFGKFSGKEPFFKKWICKNPREFQNVPVMRVLPGQTYCMTHVNHCPSKCVCYKRSFSEITIVDCEGLGMTDLPTQLPSGILDLWFSKNNITTIEPLPYFQSVRQLKLDNNNIKEIKQDVFPQFKILELLNIQSNLLTYIPTDIRKMELTKKVRISLAKNPLKCDCHSLWMKEWIFLAQNNINNWTSISCNLAREEGQQFIKVKDKDFICVEDYDTLNFVIIPSTSSSIALFVLLIISSIVLVYRFEVKVLIFVYTGLHPFDKNEDESTKDIDLFVVHGKSSDNWVQENICDFLENQDNRLNVCCQSRDFIAGFSFHDNIVSFTKRAKRMLMVLSEDFLCCDIFKISWNEARSKIEEFQTNFVLTIGHNIHLKNISNKDFKSYIKRAGFLHTSDSLIKEKMLYLLFCNKPVDSYNSESGYKTFIRNLSFQPEIFLESPFSAFVAYSEQDRSFALNEFRTNLELLSISLLLPDRDFALGFSKEENILRAVNLCEHTIFIFSGKEWLDEWLLFTFRTALGKTFCQNNNHLILVLTHCDDEQTNVEVDIKQYMFSHVTLNIKDKLFWKKLKTSLKTM